MFIRLLLFYFFIKQCASFISKNKLYRSTSIYLQVEDLPNDNNNNSTGNIQIPEQTISQFITDPNKFTTNFPVGFRKVKRENEGCDERFNIIKTHDEMIEAEESIYRFTRMFQQQTLLKYLESTSYGTINKLAAIEANSSSLLNGFNGSVQKINLTAGGLYKFWNMDEEF
jgi:hypothetical protein